MSPPDESMMHAAMDSRVRCPGMSALFSATVERRLF
jgi:hypothetical protein